MRCCPLLHLLCCLVNKPGFVLTVKLLEIRQLNTLLLFPGPLVESLQTNLKDNPQAMLSSCVILAVTVQSSGAPGPTHDIQPGTISHDLASTSCFLIQSQVNGKLHPPCEAVITLLFPPPSPTQEVTKSPLISLTSAFVRSLSPLTWTRARVLWLSAFWRR